MGCGGRERHRERGREGRKEEEGEEGEGEEEVEEERERQGKERKKGRKREREGERKEGRKGGRERGREEGREGKKRVREGGKTVCAALGQKDMCPVYSSGHRKAGTGSCHPEGRSKTKQNWSFFFSCKNKGEKTHQCV